MNNNIDNIDKTCVLHRKGKSGKIGTEKLGEDLPMLKEIQEQTNRAVKELCELARLKRGDLMVVGCSSSEVAGKRIGTGSQPEIAAAIWEGLYPFLKERGIEVAAQCCEHLNRALILEERVAAAHGWALVNVVPQPKAGGSFATAAYQGLEHPVAVEHIRAQAGLDIGGTLIGMHLAEVAVPLRLAVTHIGEALVLSARTRPKFIGGSRACYDESLL